MFHYWRTDAHGEWMREGHRFQKTECTWFREPEIKYAMEIIHFRVEKEVLRYDFRGMQLQALQNQ